VTPCREGTFALGRLVGKGLWRWDALQGRDFGAGTLCGQRDSGAGPPCREGASALGRLVGKGLWRWDLQNLFKSRGTLTDFWSYYSKKMHDALLYSGRNQVLRWDACKEGTLALGRVVRKGLWRWDAL